MKLRNVICVAAALACLGAAQQSDAGQVFGFSSDTSAGSVNSFDWDGGNAGGFGAPGTLEAAMNFAAQREGNFGGAPMRARAVNIFLVDFSTDTTGNYNDAGVTMFVMWGNGKKQLSRFTAEAQISPRMNEGNDGSFSAGTPEIFALGPGVTIDTNGPTTVDVDVDNSFTPIGYAITNIQNMPTLRTNSQWTLTGIVKMNLLGEGQRVVWRGVDDDRNDQFFTDGLVIIIPAPPAAILGLAGLGGIALVGRRRMA